MFLCHSQESRIKNEQFTLNKNVFRAIRDSGFNFCYKLHVNEIQILFEWISGDRSTCFSWKTFLPADIDPIEKSSRKFSNLEISEY